MKAVVGLALAAIGVLAPQVAAAQQASGYEAGVAARRAGHPAEAERLLREWLATHPADVDARVQLAYAELALGRLDEAEVDFKTVLAAAPGYTDASQGLALIATRRSAREDRARPTLAIEGAWSALNHGAKDWYEATAGLTSPVGSATTVDASGAYYSRFGEDDLELHGGLTVKQGENLWLRAQASVTPNADFRPKWGIGGGFDWRLTAGPSATVLTADARYEAFPLQHVTTFSPGLVKYFAGGRAWITGRAFVVIPQGRHAQVGWLARADYEPAPRYRVFAGVADGPDTDLGVVTSVTSAFGGVEIPLGTRFALTSSLAHEWRGIGPDRTELRLGVKAGL